jgi:hypothetical protein
VLGFAGQLLYVVIGDKARAKPPLLRTTGTPKVEKPIPINALHSAEENVNQAAARIVKAYVREHEPDDQTDEDADNCGDGGRGAPEHEPSCAW